MAATHTAKRDKHNSIIIMAGRLLKRLPMGAVGETKDTLPAHWLKSGKKDLRAIDSYVDVQKGKYLIFDAKQALPWAVLELKQLARQGPPSLGFSFTQPDNFTQSFSVHP